MLTLVGDTWRLDPEGLLALPYVLDVRRITPPYRLAGRAAHPENTVVEVFQKGYTLGDKILRFAMVKVAN